MPRSSELDFLKQREQAAFQHKQAAFQSYKAAKDRANLAHDEMESAWQERSLARDEMNHEYEVMQCASEQYRRVWDEYGHIRDYNNSRIDSLRYQADCEHREMVSCFEQASSEYEYGDKSMAPVYAQEGREHQARRDELNDEIGALIQEIRDAKANAEYRAPKTSSFAFHAAKEVFERAKARHESAQAEFKRLKAERDHLKAEFDSAQEEHIHLKAEFQQKLEEVKAANERDRNSALDKAGVRWSERRDAKVVKKADGTTQVYHGGVGGGDGFGHGHTALDRFGNKTYERGAFEAHGSQNFTDNNGKGVTIYDRKARPGHDVKGIEGRSNLHGQSYNSKKHPEEVGHITQFYNNGVRVSRSTTDNIHETRTHWTDTRLPKGHPDYHKKPED